MCKIWWAPNNASEWQIGCNSGFKALNFNVFMYVTRTPHYFTLYIAFGIIRGYGDPPVHTYIDRKSETCLSDIIEINRKCFRNILILIVVRCYEFWGTGVFFFLFYVQKVRNSINNFCGITEGRIKSPNLIFRKIKFWYVM